MSETCNVFICWSGKRSRFVAEFLRGWLRVVIQAARPWMSEVDAEAGSRWFDEVARALEDAKVGICCLTPENLNTPWLLFESGALSKSIRERARVCTYLLVDALRPEDVPPPLAMFQGVRADKEGTLKLVQAVNSALGHPVPENNLDRVFDPMWDQLAKILQSLPPPEEVVQTKRTSEDMLAEMLETLRGLDSVMRGLASVMKEKTAPPRPAAPAAGPPGQDPRLTAIKDVLFERSKFVSSCLNPLAEVRFGDGEVHFVYPKEAAWAVDLMKAREHYQRLASVCEEVLGQQVTIHLTVQKEPEITDDDLPF
jgi:hypothetical protein